MTGRFKMPSMPWLVWLNGQSDLLQTRRSPVRSQSRHKPGLWPGPQLGVYERQPHTDISLPLSHPSPLSKNKYIHTFIHKQINKIFFKKCIKTTTTKPLKMPLTFSQYHTFPFPISLQKMPENFQSLTTSLEFQEVKRIINMQCFETCKVLREKNFSSNTCEAFQGSHSVISSFTWSRLGWKQSSPFYRCQKRRGDPGACP